MVVVTEQSEMFATETEGRPSGDQGVRRSTQPEERRVLPAVKDCYLLTWFENIRFGTVR